MDDDAVELTPRYLPERLFMDSRSEDVPAAEEPGAFSFQAMQREARELAALTEHYYERGYWRNVKYTL